MKSLTTLFADFNNADKEGRIRLITAGTINGLKSQNVILVQGLEVLLDDHDELTATGIVEYSDSENIWVAKINWNSFK
jgi:hypothetical protein